MDDTDHFIGLILFCSLGAGLALGSYFLRHKLKSSFHRLGRLGTQAFATRLSLEFMKSLFVPRRETTSSRGEFKLHTIADFLNAAESGNLSEIKRLTNEGMDVNVRRAPGGRTALMKASQNGNVDVVRFLLRKGANVDIVGGRSGKTALIRASEKGHWEIVEALLMAQAQVNARGKGSGKTALMAAVEHGNLAVAELLMRAGADVHKRDNQGRTAADIGVACGQDEMMKILEGKGTFGNHEQHGRTKSQCLDDDECYVILGCRETDSPDQIRARYHALMKEFHPDRIQAKGMSAAFAKIANERCLITQEAYQQIKKKVLGRERRGRPGG
jgi:uncharacterized protein